MSFLLYLVPSDAVVREKDVFCSRCNNVYMRFFVLDVTIFRRDVFVLVATTFNHFDQDCLLVENLFSVLLKEGV